MSFRGGLQPLPVDHRPRLTILPTTRSGWWAVGLAGAFFVLVLTEVITGSP